MLIELFHVEVVVGVPHVFQLSELGDELFFGCATCLAGGPLWGHQEYERYEIPGRSPKSKSRNFIFSTALMFLYSGLLGYRNIARSQLNNPSAFSLSAQNRCTRNDLALLSRITRVHFFPGLRQEQDLGLTKTSCSTGSSEHTSGSDWNDQFAYASCAERYICPGTW